MFDRRFPTALQIMQSLVLTAHKADELISSAQFADGLRANPTLIRKLITTLVQHGLLESRLGRKGGVRLARPAEQITLRDIYEAATLGSKKLWTPRQDLPKLCVVSTFFPLFFDRLSEEADATLLELLESKSLADSFAELLKLETQACKDQGYHTPYEKRNVHPSGRRRTA